MEDVLTANGLSSLYSKTLKESFASRKKLFKRKGISNIGTLSYAIFSNILNFLSIFIFIAQTFVDNNSDDESTRITDSLNLIDFILACYFLSEYVFSPIFLTRLELRNHFFSIILVIDAVSIFNSFFTYIMGRVVKLQFLRIFRSVKIYRIFKIYKEYKKIQSQIIKEEEVTENNLANPIRQQLISLIITFVCSLFISSGIVLLLNDLTSNAFSINNLNFIDAFYFAAVTSTTIGYGDIIPTNGYSRLAVLLLIFVFIYLLSDQVTKIISLLSVWGSETLDYIGSNHIIVIYKGINISIKIYYIGCIGINPFVSNYLLIK